MKKINKIRLFSAAIVMPILALSIYPSASFATGPTVTVGTTSTFAVLGATTVTNTGATSLSGTAGGDLGLSPGTSFTGSATVTMSGVQHITDGAALTAQTDLTTAFNSASAPTPTVLAAPDLAGQTITPGTYSTASGTFANSGHLILDAQNDPTAVFIFKAASTLTTASSSSITLANGAQACHVFWVVGSSATLGTNSTFVGHIFAQVSITATTGASIKGSLLARTGAVTLDTNTIVNDACAAIVVPTPTPTPYVPVPNGTLHIVKHVINDGGGTALASDFMIHVTQYGHEVVGSPAVGIDGVGRVYSLTPGAYVVSEDANPSYVGTFAGTTTGAITVVSSQDRVVTITNDDINLATLHVVKKVINDGGGTAVAGDFMMRVTLHGVDVAGSPATGVDGAGRAYRLAPGSYVVSEVAKAGYNGRFLTPGMTTGFVTLVSNQDLTIVRTNDDVNAAPVVVPAPTPIPTPVPTPTGTVNGGTLPKTDTPWNNLLALGAGLILLGAVGFTSKKVLN